MVDTHFKSNQNQFLHLETKKILSAPLYILLGRKHMSPKWTFYGQPIFLRNSFSLKDSCLFLFTFDSDSGSGDSWVCKCLLKFELKCSDATPTKGEGGEWGVLPGTGSIDKSEGRVYWGCTPCLVGLGGEGRGPKLGGRWGKSGGRNWGGNWPIGG